MARFSQILDFFGASPSDEGTLLPTFQDLVDMRRQVPYLKDFRFKQTSNISGDVRSSFKGRGMEFAEVRAYSLSDDARDIDWRVTARKNQPFTKLYTEEKDRQVYVWLDISDSMRFGTKKELKSVSAAKAAALVGWFALQNKDRFGLAIYDGQRTRLYDASRTEENLLQILKQIEKIAAESLNFGKNTASAAQSLQKLQAKLSSRAIIFVLSAFEDFSPAFEKILMQMSRKHELYAVYFFDKLEETPPPKGQYPAQNEAEKIIINSNGATFNRTYQAFFNQKRENLRQKCARFGCAYREIRTDLALAGQLRPI